MRVRLKQSHSIINRGKALVEEARVEQLDYPKRKPNKVIDKIRFGVVFLHAGLEHYLRATEYQYLIKVAISKSVKKVIKTYTDEEGDGDKKIKLSFDYSSLPQAQQQVITSEIKKSLEAKHTNSKRTFNDAASIKELCSNLGIFIDLKLIYTLEQMMRKRHKIVHNGDLVPKKRGSGLYAPMISFSAYDKWYNDVLKLIDEIDKEVSKKLSGKKRGRPKGSKNKRKKATALLALPPAP